MIRYLLPLVLVAVPLAAYVVWYRMAREAALRKAEGTLPGWRDAPWTFIVLGTLAALILVLAVFGLVGPDPGGEYVPARLEDGVVVPGYVAE